MSWNDDTGTPSFSMYTRCSRVLGAPIFRTEYLEVMFEGLLELVERLLGGEVEKCWAIWTEREWILARWGCKVASLSSAALERR
jgi:hypothetical protein